MGVFLPTLPTLGTSDQDGTLWTATRAPKGPEQANPLPTLIGVVVQSIVEVAILCAVGWYLARRGIVDAKAKKTLNKINTSLFTPCLLFNKVAFSLTPDKLAELYIIPIGFVLVSCFSAAVAYSLGKATGLKKGQRNFAIACATFQNSNSLPIALLQSLIGEKLPLAWGPHDTKDGMLGRGLSYLVLFSSLGIIVRWSIGVRLLSSAEAVTEDGAIPGGDDLEGAAAVAASSSSSQRQTSTGNANANDNASETTLRPLGIATAGAREDDQDEREQDGFVYSSSSLGDRTTDADDHDDDDDDDDESSSSVASDDAEEWGYRRGFGRRPNGFFSGPRATRFKRFPSRAWKRVKRIGRMVGEFMTVPLWAAVLSLAVACIPPVQHTLNKAEPLKAAIRSAGSCSVPITLVTLGAYFYAPSAAAAADTVTGADADPNPIDPDSDQSREAAISTAEQKRRATRNENLTIFVAVISRMVVVPAVLIPLFAYYAKMTINVADDPIFVVVACLLIGSPTAITLAQITSSAAGPTFERLISRTLFVSYAFLTCVLPTL
ncbi:auxin efflux carrier [Rhodotorula sp. JG-1b]|nr:auxin efflux carrier [Rhodotorula sp. JG-1b]